MIWRINDPIWQQYSIYVRKNERTEMAATLADALTDSSLFEAWIKVRNNRGAPGVDGQTIEDFEENLLGNLGALRKEVRDRTYRSLPLLRVEIPKSSEGMRPLSIPAVRDRVLQTAVALVLTPLFEAEFEDSSFAYRKGRSVRQAVRRIECLRDEGFRWVVDADIDDFFSEIDQTLLMIEVEELVRDEGIRWLLHLWLEAEVQDGEHRYRLRKGVPQGSPISPLLSNLYLDHLDEALLDERLRLVRYADDFLILCKDKSGATDALELTAEVLEGLRLRINHEKTRVVDFNQGFRFLGVQFIRTLAFKVKYDDQDPFVPSLGEAMRDRQGEPLGRKPMEQDAPTAASNENISVPESNTFSGNDAGFQGSALADAFIEAGVGPGDFQEQPGMPQQIEPPPEEALTKMPPGQDPRLRTLYLFKHGSVLGKESERFVIRREGRLSAEIPALKVDQIMVFGNAQITTQAMHFCLLEKIPVFLLSAQGRFYGLIDSFDTDPVHLHRDQFRRADDPGFCLNLAREFVRGKLANSRLMLTRLSRKRDAPALRKAAQKVARLISRLDGAQTLDELRGYEGTAAHAYFSAFAATLSPEWRFRGRVRQPPTDPVNALLSYGYTLLFYNVYSFLRARGLNPHVGFLHPLRAGHPALASDLIEEFRSIVVDAVVWTFVLNKRLTPEDFDQPTAPNRPCLLNTSGRRKFIGALENKMNAAVRHPVSGLNLDYRRCMEHQVNHLAAIVRGKHDRYLPMILR